MDSNVVSNFKTIYSVFITFSFGKGPVNKI